MKVNHLKVFLPMLACLLALLVVLICVPEQVHAQTGITPYRTLGTVTFLKQGKYNNYYFSPTYISCRVNYPCLTIVNNTGNRVILTDDFGQYVTTLRSGSKFSDTFYDTGVFYFYTTGKYTRVPLTVYVYDGGYSGPW